MRGLGLNRILLGTALAVVLAAPGSHAWAQSDADAAIAAKVPMPDFADLPPPSVKDVRAAPGLDVDSLVPMPQNLNFPPPTRADVGPVTPAAPVVAAPAVPVPAAQPEVVAAPVAPAAAVAPAVVATPVPAPAAQPEVAATPAAPKSDAAPASVAMPAAPAAAPTDATASVPAAASVPAVAAIDPADQAITDKLRETIAGRQFERIVPNRKERAAIEAFYQARNAAPLWSEKGVTSARAKLVTATMQKADMIGLDPKEYRTPDFTAAMSPQDAAEAELKFTSTVLTYARHAQSGRTDPSRISANIEYKLPMPDPDDVLAQVSSSTDIAKTLAEFEPPHDGYRALRKKLAELRGGANEPTVVRIPEGGLLRPMAKPMQDERVPLLRQRLHVTGDAADKNYDDALVEAVKAFQASAGLSVDGVLGNNTVNALNGPRKGNQIDAVVASMERWRWLPRELGTNYVMINIPDFSLKVVKGDTIAWKTRIVVGKPSTPTPIFSAQIENILVNPSWHVPESIIYGEYMPALERDPGVLARMGLKVGRNRDGSVSITQPPGPGNALGRIKFNFQNRFQVYLHDTPDKNLFAHDRRSYSHGCMRVQNPDQFGEVLASIALPGQGYTAAKLTSMYGKGEAWLNFKNKVPVHITYMTAYVDDAGKLVVREDIYNHDGRVLAALKGSDRDYGQEEVMAQIKRTAPTKRRDIVQREEPSPIETFFRIFR